MTTSGEPIEYRCLIRATDGKKTISTSVSIFFTFKSFLALWLQNCFKLETCAFL